MSIEPTFAWVRKRPLWAALLIGLVLAGVATAGYAAGSQTRVVTEQATWQSFPGDVACELDGGGSIGFNPVIVWTDGPNTINEGSRPACLPPDGPIERPVQISWVEVDVEGISWRQALRVDC